MINHQQTGLRLVLLALAIAGMFGIYRVLDFQQSSETDNTTTPVAQPTTFNKHVAPIIHQNCSMCHRPGEATPFSIITYRDVRKRAGQIMQVIDSGFMPPWLPDPDFGHFDGERRLEPEEIEILRRWIAAKMPEGDAADYLPLPKRTPGWQLGKPDLIVELSETYTLPADGPDTFRNFVIPFPGDKIRWVRALEFRPRNRQIVHHAVIHTDGTKSAREYDRKDPGVGFGGMYMGGSVMPDNYFIGWTRGTVPSPLPAGMAWKLTPGDDFVLQLHLTPSGKSEQVRPRVGLYFTDYPKPVDTFPILLHREDFSIPPGEKNYVVIDEYVLPIDAEMVSVYPHAHFLGKQMEGYATLPDGTRKWLFKIRQWDFNWQDQFRYVEPIFIPKDSKITMRIVYDNSAENVVNPNHPPRRVFVGNEATDEMANLQIEIRPVQRDPKPR